MKSSRYAEVIKSLFEVDPIETREPHWRAGCPRPSLPRLPRRCGDAWAPGDVSMNREVSQHHGDLCCTYCGNGQRDVRVLIAILAAQVVMFRCGCLRACAASRRRLAHSLAVRIQAGARDDTPQYLCAQHRTPFSNAGGGERA
jgi:hypothetical protein